ncbi:transferrin-binding protein-like solute binding protein [Actinobacillus equuli]|uniref:transferrin-binding protein-like solute binding protein n=1 Tax=Actinobacillus equuli TaxID=718 RepID=UPI0024421BF6|nr:transferrin-binding protein-like solute binding protein [Actinobacillus equuli]WGE48307.1 transferrin-binding protein-like solute binding protein [Actinobacillus equuli subsp. equuli]
MNVVTKLTATLAASLILTACSGGSSGSATKPNNQKAKTDIPAPKVEQSKEAASQADNLKVEQPKEVVPQVDNSKVEQPKEAIPQADNSKVEQPKEVVPQVDNSKVEQPKEVVPQVDNSKVEQPKEVVPQVDNSKVEQPKEAVPQVDNSKVEQPKEVAPQVDHSNMEQPKEVAPQVNEPKSEDSNKDIKLKDKSNEEILKELGVKDINSGNISISDVVLNLQLDNNDSVTISLLDEDLKRGNLAITNKISSSDIRTLKDSTGRLLGYYGYMQLNQVREGERDGINDADLVGYYLLSMDESSKMIPSKSMKYNGHMLYSYKNVDNQNLVADVQASYNDADKKLSMKIFDNHGGYWQLGEFNKVKLLEKQVNGVKVNGDGSISNAMLFSQKIDDTPGKLTPDANFSGGIFGKNGEVLTGSAISEKWQGVIGATATEEKK